MPTENFAPWAFLARSLNPIGYLPKPMRWLLAAGLLLMVLRPVLADDRIEAAVGFLKNNLPERDAGKISDDFLRFNASLTYKALDESNWRDSIPNDIVLNGILPYANLNERRDDWRKDFHERFSPLVKNCKRPGEAALVLNEKIFKILNVTYHPTKRPKPDQSPYESIEAGYASCSGLSILLVNACRAVGVPARIVGTPAWTTGKGDGSGNHGGNHTWVQIWDDGWHTLGAAEVSPLDQTWFLENTAKADASKPTHRIYAASYAKTDIHFPMVWAMEDKGVFAEDVTAMYSKANAIREYACRRATSPIVIDGKLDDVAWNDAPWSDDFIDIEGSGKPAPRFRTRMKMLWDDTHLYFAAQLDEPHVWGTLTKKNSIIYNDNDFEIFIDPDGDGLNYYEFEVNALNTVMELVMDKPYHLEGKYTFIDMPGLRSAVHVEGTLNDPRDEDRFWSVEVAMPWKSLERFAGSVSSPPKTGEVWRVNFSRVQWRHEVVDGKYVKIPKDKSPEDNWVWSPIGRVDMHRPGRWGKVRFSG